MDIKARFNSRILKKGDKELDISDDTVWKYINDINEFYEKDTERAYQRWQEELTRIDDKNKWME